MRTFRRLRNVFSLCVVAYLFVTRHLRASSRFKGIVKAIRDNCTERSLTTIKLHFFVPEEFLADCKFAYETFHPYWSDDGNNVQTYMLNGHQIAQEDQHSKLVSVKLPSEYLQAGENVLEIRMPTESDKKLHWLQFDYHRLVMKPKRGLRIVVQ